MLLHRLGSGPSTASFPPSANNVGFLPPTAAHLHYSWEQQQQQQPSFSSAFPFLAFPPHRPTLSSPLPGQHGAVSPALLAQQPHLQPPRLPSKEGYLSSCRAESLQLQPAAQLSPMLSAQGGLLMSKGGGWNAGSGDGGGGGGGGEVGCADAAIAGDGSGGGGLGLWEAPGPGSGPDLNTLMAIDMCGGLQDEDDYFDGLMERIGGEKDGGNLGVVGGGSSNTIGSQQLLPGAAVQGQQPGLHGALLHQQLLDNAAAAAAATAAAHAANAAHHRPPFMLGPHHPQHPVPLQPCNSGSSSNTTGDATASAGAEGGSAASAPHTQPPQAAHHCTLAHAFSTPPHECLHGLPPRAMSGALHHQLAVGEPADEVLQQLPLMAPALSSGHLVQGQDSKTSGSSSMGGAPPPASATATAAHTMPLCCDAPAHFMVDAPLAQAQPPPHSTGLPAELFQALIHDLN
ncbi:hypothetical protein DUNSADRAFT_10745 [Dunaliella salina]|uniref:Uncharacterized protein n=1 Tax=Dunaliella salina TaxID=3046 RepID=A0ABQ7GEL4_DUNSA|nr:hypothetical protein DUNSADRAFT_10745 [Dunaliella salina]|eukprot:KAF5833039.1 hypothetical protein DUNSADRAFT_10745 [Dunaliella salina]